MFEAFFESIAFHQDTIDPNCQEVHRDDCGLLKINSKIVLKIGTHGCGKHLTMETNVDTQTDTVHKEHLYFSIMWDFDHTYQDFVCIASDVIFQELKDLVPLCIQESIKVHYPKIIQ